jgi:hypothetical protein
MTMSSRVILGLVAATLMGVTLVPVDALAHHPARLRGLRVCDAADHRGWNAFSRNPGQMGFPGPHYGCDCYRAASGRAMCAVF